MCHGFGLCGSKVSASDLVQPYIPFNFLKSQPIKRSAGVGLEHKRLLGTNKCTWGPSFWCSSEEAMAECNVSIKKKKPQLVSIIISIIIVHSFSHLRSHTPIVIRERMHIRCLIKGFAFDNHGIIRNIHSLNTFFFSINSMICN